MRALGPPNTPHFYHIPSISEALGLWERLRGSPRLLDAPAPDAVEECEDRQGNVYTRRTYDDLVKQGLL